MASGWQRGWWRAAELAEIGEPWGSSGTPLRLRCDQATATGRGTPPPGRPDRDPGQRSSGVRHVRITTPHPRSRSPLGLGRRPRLHGNVRVLRRPERRRVRRHDPPGARPRHRLPRHGRRVRPVHQRAARRPRHQGTAGRGCGGHQIRQRAGGGRLVPRHQRPARLHPPGVRRIAQAARRGPHRSLLPAPGGPLGPDRGDGRRDGRAGAGGQGQASRAERSVRANHPSRGARAPDHRAADGVLALDPRPRGRDPAHLPRARYRLRCLQPARPRVPHRPVPLARRSPTRRLPPHSRPGSRARTSRRTSTW